MKTIQKITAAVIAMVMMCALFASCSSGSYTKDNTEFVIGAVGPLTGEAASYGVSVQEGAQLAVDQINANGGLNGILFKFDIKDDKAAAADAGIGYDTLFESGMQISLGGVTSGACKAFAAKAQQDNLFFITPTASEQAIIETGDNAFRVCFGDPDQGVFSAKTIKELGYQKVGAIYQTSESYSVGIYEAFKAEMQKYEIPVIEQKFDSENSKDFSTQADALKDCDVIFMPFYYEAAALFIKTAAAKGSTADFFGCDGFDGIAGQFTESDKVANKITYVTPFDANSTKENVSAFVSAYKAAYNGKTPDQFAADAYDAIMVIYELMKAADIKDVTISASDLCDIVKAKIVSSDFSYSGVTGDMVWDASGASNKAPQIVEFSK